MVFYSRSPMTIDDDLATDPELIAPLAAEPELAAEPAAPLAGEPEFAALAAEPEPEVMSKTAFAFRRGVRINNLLGWISRGVLDHAALTADGMIRVAEAERQLASRLIATGAGVMRPDTIERMQRLSAAAAVAAGIEPAAPGALDDSPAARRARAVAEMAEIDLERRRRQLAEQKGVYVRADQVRANRGRALAQMIAAIDNWLPEIAAELALDRQGFAVLRSSWRRFRERQAESAVARAQSLPEAVEEGTGAVLSPAEVADAAAA